MSQWRPIAETAEALGINFRTIYKLIDDGLIDAGTAMKVTHPGHAPRAVRAVRPADVARHVPEPATKKLPDIQHDYAFATRTLGMAVDQALEWVARGYNVQPKQIRRVLGMAS